MAYELQHIAQPTLFARIRLCLWIKGGLCVEGIGLG